MEKTRWFRVPVALDLDNYVHILISTRNTIQNTDYFRSQMYAPTFLAACAHNTSQKPTSIDFWYSFFAFRGHFWVFCFYFFLYSTVKSAAEGAEAPAPPAAEPPKTFLMARGGSIKTMVLRMSKTGCLTDLS